MHGVYTYIYIRILYYFLSGNYGGDIKEDSCSYGEGSVGVGAFED